MTEVWQAIPSAPGYEASTDGRIRSVNRVIATRQGPRKQRGQVLSAFPQNTGYLVVPLGRFNVRTVHSLVAEAFYGPRPEGTEVCHGPGGQQDNSLANIRYGTHSDNVRDSVTERTHLQTSREICPRGHDLVEPNLEPYALRAGRRSCLSCHRAYSAHYRKYGSVDTASALFRADANWRYAERMGYDNEAMRWRSLARDVAAELEAAR